MRQLSENTFQSFNMEVYERIFFSWNFSFLSVNLLNFICASQVKSHTSNEFTLDLIYQEIVDTDDCVHNQCVEGSTCVDLPFRYTCACPTGKGGRYCEGTHRTTLLTVRWKRKAYLSNQWPFVSTSLSTGSINIYFYGSIFWQLLYFFTLSKISLVYQLQWVPHGLQFIWSNRLISLKILQIIVDYHFKNFASLVFVWVR